MNIYSSGINAYNLFKEGNIITVLVDDDITRIVSKITGIVVHSKSEYNRYYVAVLLKSNVIVSLYAQCIEEEDNKLYLRNDSIISISHEYINLNNKTDEMFDSIGNISENRFARSSSDYINQLIDKTYIKPEYEYYFGEIADEQCPRANYYLQYNIKQIL